MQEVFFGLGVKFDDGSHPGVGINKSGTVIEVHHGEVTRDLWYRLGSPYQATVKWGPNNPSFGKGKTPVVALNDKGDVIEIHKHELKDTLEYRLGKVAGSIVEWSPATNYDTGVEPGVGLNGAGVIVAVARGAGKNHLHQRVGRIVNGTVDWGAPRDYDEGAQPKVAVNNSGTVVEVHKSAASDRLWCRVGQVFGFMFDLGTAVEFAKGTHPAVAINDAGEVIVVFKSGKSLHQRFGRIGGSGILWLGESEKFDDGSFPSVAVSGSMSINIHEGEILRTLWYSTSLITDRSKWMRNRMNELGNRKLSQIVFPASHDSGMYLEKGLDVFAKTQNLSIYDQLAAGIRWFDLRPGWDESAGDFFDYHGIIRGPRFSEILSDVKTFCSQRSRELMILKLSHFHKIDAETYKKLVREIQRAIEPWLVKSIPSGKSRLADATFGEYFPNTSTICKVLVVVDDDYAINHKVEGFWVYRDWYAQKPAQGDLTVFDVYSDVMEYSKMKADQTAKFNAFNGLCKNDPSVPCDLFLLSWTVTPPTDVWLDSKDANRHLGLGITELTIPNRYGKIVNMDYVDYCEFARVTDVVLYQNGAPHVAVALDSEPETEPQPRPTSPEATA